MVMGRASSTGSGQAADCGGGPCPRQLEQGFRSGRAVARGLELIRAGGAAGGPAFDATQMIERELDLGPAATTAPHLAPPRARDASPGRQEAFQGCAVPEPIDSMCCV